MPEPWGMVAPPSTVLIHLALMGKPEHPVSTEMLWNSHFFQLAVAKRAAGNQKGPVETRSHSSAAARSGCFTRGSRRWFANHWLCSKSSFVLTSPILGGIWKISGNGSAQYCFRLGFNLVLQGRWIQRRAGHGDLLHSWRGASSLACWRKLKK